MKAAIPHRMVSCQGIFVKMSVGIWRPLIVLFSLAIKHSRTSAMKVLKRLMDSFGVLEVLIFIALYLEFCVCIFPSHSLSLVFLPPVLPVSSPLSHFSCPSTSPSLSLAAAVSETDVNISFLPLQSRLPSFH